MILDNPSSDQQSVLTLVAIPVLSPTLVRLTCASFLCSIVALCCIIPVCAEIPLYSAPTASVWALSLFYHAIGLVVSWQYSRDEHATLIADPTSRRGIAYGLVLALLWLVAGGMAVLGAWVYRFDELSIFGDRVPLLVATATFDCLESLLLGATVSILWRRREKWVGRNVEGEYTDPTK